MRGRPNSVGPSTFIEVGRGSDWDMALLSRRLSVAPLMFERWYMAKGAPLCVGQENAGRRTMKKDGKY